MIKKFLALFFMLILSLYPIFNAYSYYSKVSSPSDEMLDGIEIIESLISIDLSEIEEKIAQVYRIKEEIYKTNLDEAAKQELIDALISEIEIGNTTYRSVFKDVFIVGDSLMNGLANYEILNEDNMITKISANLYDLQDNIEAILEEQPEVLILHYGLNHVEEESVQCTRFINLYTSILQEIIEGLDDTRIIVSSIFPVDLEINTDPKFERIEVYNDALEQMCEDLGIEFLRNDVTLFDEEVYDSDGIHMLKKFYTTSWLNYLIEVLELY